MPQLTQVQKLAFQDNNAICLVRVVDSCGTELYAYLEETREQYEFINNACEKGEMIKLLEHGTLIVCGIGEPSASVKHYMENEYNFKHEETEEKSLHPETQEHIKAKAKSFVEKIRSNKR